MGNELSLSGKGWKFDPKSLDEALQYAKLVASSGLVPAAYKDKPNDVLIAMEWGAEIGLSRLQSLQGIAVINGRPCVWGDAALALVQASGLLESLKETDDGHIATFEARRKGNPEPIVRTFSQDDAKSAGLAGKQGPWSNYPKRMRQMRARGFGLRDGFADALKGMSIAEEVQDYEVLGNVAPGVDVVKPIAGPVAKVENKTATEKNPNNQDTSKASDEVKKSEEFSKVTKLTAAKVDGKPVFYVYLNDRKYATFDEKMATKAKEWKEKGTELYFNADKTDLLIEIGPVDVPV